MKRKEKEAKRKEFFSLKAYLYKKAQKRLIKLQSREQDRQEKATKVLENKSTPLVVTEEDIHQHS